MSPNAVWQSSLLLTLDTVDRSDVARYGQVFVSVQQTYSFSVMSVLARALCIMSTLTVVRFTFRVTSEFQSRVRANPTFKLPFQPWSIPGCWVFSNVACSVLLRMAATFSLATSTGPPLLVATSNFPSLVFTGPTTVLPSFSFR